MNEPGVPPTPPPAEPPGGAPPPPPPTCGTGGEVSPNRSLWIVLSYLWILALVPLLVEKEDREVQWHAKHGLVLFGVEIVISIIIAIINAALSFVDFGCTGCILYSIFWIVVLVVHVVAIAKGVNGQRFIIPNVSQLADRF